MANKPLLIIGGGGHASVLVEVLLEQGREILGVLAPAVPEQRRVFEGIPHYSNDDEILNFNAGDVRLINGIGGVPFSNLRQNVDTKFRSLGFSFDSVIDVTARVSRYSTLGDGIQILANATVQTGAVLGRGAIINTSAIVEHDSRVGENTHIAPGAVLAGGVSVGDNSFIGCNSVTIEGITLGNNVVVGAGVTVLTDVASEVRYLGKNNESYFQKSED